jgi:hypothetical protein
MDDEAPKKPLVFSLPYPMMVKAQEAVRPKEDFWKFRVLTNVLRQTPAQIKKYKERYNGDF